MSAREDLAEKIWEAIKSLGLDTAPVVGPMGLSADNKYRSVYLGWARYLDGEVRIYSPNYFVYRDSRSRFEKFTSFDAVVNFLRTEICSKPSES